MAFHSLGLLAGALVALTACGAAEEDGPARETGVRAVVPVGDQSTISGVAVGEGGVWAAGWDARGTAIWRIDPGRSEVVARIPVHGANGVAAGEGAVWVVGDARVSRVDPHTNEVVATIPFEAPPGVRSAAVSPFMAWVVVGEGAVWVSVSWDPWTGEVIRIDPHTNEVIARIDTRGHPGELALGAGSVWILSDPAYTDEADGGASLHRIDPRSNEIVGTPLREELPMIGGTVIPPTLAVDHNAAWVRSARDHIPLGIRVDAYTGEVARERIRYFSPVAVTDDGVWFMGAELSRLNPRTLEVEESIGLGAALGEGLSAADATFDPESRSLWIVAQAVRRGRQSAVIRVDLR